MGMAGFILVYAGAFLYEDEQQAIQNRLENWWRSLDKIETRDTTIHADFLLKLTVGIGQFFDRLLGSYKSWQSCGTNCCLGCLSATLFFICLIAELPHHNWLMWYGPSLIWAFVFLALILVPFLDDNNLNENKTNRRTSWKLLVVLSNVAFFFNINSSAIRLDVFFRLKFLQLHDCLILLMNLVLWSLLMVFVNVLSWFNRETILSLTRLKWKKWIVLTLYLIFPALGYGPIYLNYFRTKTEIWIGSQNGFMGGLILMDILGAFWAAHALIFLFMWTLLLFHCLFWQILKRSVYAFRRHNIIHQSKTLISIGITLIVFAFPKSSQELKGLIDAVLK
jgi:hypothetical protein